MFRNNDGEAVRVTGVTKNDALLAFILKTPLVAIIDGIPFRATITDFRASVDPGVIAFTLCVAIEGRWVERVPVPCYVLRNDTGGTGYRKRRASPD